MNLEQYLPLAIRTEKTLPRFDRMVHACMGLVTEVGEVVTELKRMAIYGKPLDAERKVHIREEVGDVMWYVAIMLHAMETPLTMVTYVPHFQLLETKEGKYEAITLMIGEHVGGACALVQHLKATGTDQQVEKSILVELAARMSMLMKGMYVLAIDCDSTIEAEMDANIAKLQLRFPDKFSEEAAEARADKGGLDARSS